MSLILKDRVRETSIVTSTNDATLLGAVTGFQSFSVVGNGNTCYYTIADQSGGNWEVGIGTYTASGSVLSRDVILASSNGNTKVSFPAGTKDVFLTYPSEKAVYLDESGNLNIYSDGELRLNDATGGEYVALKSPAVLSASYTLTMPADDGTNGQALITDGSGNLSWSSAASGDVYGPASATDNAVARFDGTTGKIIQNSVMTIADDGASVLSVNSSSDALRITQTGSGNALVVEDSANPDSTPFVVTADGNVGIGTTVPTTGLSIVRDGNTQFNFVRNSDNTAPPYFVNIKRRGTEASKVIVNNNDQALSIQAYGYDGSSDKPLAFIDAYVDGVPGTNDMPGRLVFSTTADGASSPTERMRITNAGQFGINGAPTSGNYQFQLGGTIISAGTASYGFVADTTVPSVSTASANMFYTSLKTQAAAFTLSTATHFSASQGTIGAGSAITSQYGFIANNTLTGATNNYGFYSNIASGTGRYNFYAAGSADNYFAGSMGIGVLPTVNNRLTIASNRGAQTYGLVVDTYNGASFENSFVYQFNGSVQSIGNYQNFPLAFLTNNTERMRIDSSGNVGIGGTPVAVSLFVAKNITGAVSTSGILSYGTVQSDVTTYGIGVNSQISTSASSFTLNNLVQYYAAQGTIGAGSTVTNQYGYLAASNFTGATNNYGFYSNIASGTGRYNFYAGGSADNYFAGKVGVGAAPTGGVELFQSGGQTTSAITTNTNIESFFVARQNSASAGAGGGIIFGAQSGSFAAIKGLLTNGTGNSVGDLAFSTRNATGDSTLTERMRIDSSGNVGIGGMLGSDTKFAIAGTLPSGGTGSYGNRVVATGPSASTGGVVGFDTSISTTAAAYTLASLIHYNAGQGTIGAGSTVTSQFGFSATGTLTGATNNYGLYSNIASGTGRWNFYAAGSANNFFAGNVGIGAASPPSTLLHVAQAADGEIFRLQRTGGTNIPILRVNLAESTNVAEIEETGAVAGSIAFKTGAAERMRIDSNGNLISTAPATAPTLSTNGTMVFNLTSNTNLRVSVRGSDGVTRTANITLA